MSSYRAPKAPGSLVVKMTQSFWRAGEILIEKEKEGRGRGEEREARANKGDPAPCQNPVSQTLRNEREAVTAESGAKHLRGWLHP